MTLASPSPTTIENLIFGHDNSDSPQTNEDDSENARAQSSGENEDIIDRRSMYVKLFEGILRNYIISHALAHSLVPLVRDASDCDRYGAPTFRYRRVQGF